MIRGIIRTAAKYYMSALMLTVFVIMELEGIPYSDLFVAVLVATLGTTGIMVYGDTRK